MVLADGAEVLLDGRESGPAGNGNFVAPTIIAIDAAAAPNMECYTEARHFLSALNQ